MTENATVSHSHTHALEATGLKKHYGPRNVVKGVSLAVKSGEVVGLLGKNGAGKTTTFYMVVGLVVADDGQIRLDGQDITHMPIYKRARMGLSYLPRRQASSASSPSRTTSAPFSSFRRERTASRFPRT